MTKHVWVILHENGEACTDCENPFLKKADAVEEVRFVEGESAYMQSCTKKHFITKFVKEEK